MSRCAVHVARGTDMFKRKAPNMNIRCKSFKIQNFHSCSVFTDVHSLLVISALIPCFESFAPAANPSRDCFFLCWQYVSVRLLSKIHSCRSLVTILSVGKFMEMLGIYHESEYIYIYISLSGMCELELFWCQATFASDFRTFRDVIPHDSRWFLSVLSQSSIPAPPPFRAAAAPAPSWCAWQAEMVELSNCGTLWNIVELFLSSRKPRMPMVCHICQWSFQGFGYKQVEMVSFSFGCSCLHTDHRFEKKTMCIASLLPSEHISWYLWHFPSSTRPTWEYDSFNWHRWRPLILTRDLI